jgi:predicted dehydrogenase
MISESYHPFWENWWPRGHMIGWEHTFIHEISDLLDAIVNDKDIAPHGATFEDGYKNAVICDAILQSAESERYVAIKY